MLHGVLFFGLFWIISDRVGFAWRLLLAACIEAASERVENSPFVVDRYRHGTVSLGYTGDSVINSLSDVAGSAVGFFLARRLGLRASLGLCVAVEVAMLFWSRDDLTLNVLMLVRPVDAVRRWQAGG